MAQTNVNGQRRFSSPGAIQSRLISTQDNLGTAVENFSGSEFSHPHDTRHCRVVSEPDTHKPSIATSLDRSIGTGQSEHERRNETSILI